MKHICNSNLLSCNSCTCPVRHLTTGSGIHFVCWAVCVLPSKPSSVAICAPLLLPPDPACRAYNFTAQLFPLRRILRLCLRHFSSWLQKQRWRPLCTGYVYIVGPCCFLQPSAATSEEANSGWLLFALSAARAGGSKQHSSHSCVGVKDSSIITSSSNRISDSNNDCFLSHRSVATAVLLLKLLEHAKA